MSIAIDLKIKTIWCNLCDVRTERNKNLSKYKENQMNARKTKPDSSSPWRRKKDAMSYFSIGYQTLERLAKLANAKCRVGNICLYNVERISLLLDDSLDFTQT